MEDKAVKRIFLFFFVMVMVTGLANIATAEQNHGDPWTKVEQMRNEALSSLPSVNGKADEETMDMMKTLEVSGKKYEVYDEQARIEIEALNESVNSLSEEIVAKYATVEIRDSDPEVSDMYNGRMWIVLAAEEEPEEKVYPPFFTIGYCISFNGGLITYDWRNDRIGVATLNSDGVAPSIPAGTTYVSETAYPIPVPADATTISVVCDGYMWGVAGFVYADGTYTYNLDPGWKSSGQTVSLEAGSVDYVVFNLKKTDNSDIPKGTDTSGISIVIE
jgi:hypothetical protein